MSYHEIPAIGDRWITVSVAHCTSTRYVQRLPLARCSRHSLHWRPLHTNTMTPTVTSLHTPKVRLWNAISWHLLTFSRAFTRVSGFSPAMSSGWSQSPQFHFYIWSLLWKRTYSRGTLQLPGTGKHRISILCH